MAGGQDPKAFRFASQRLRASKALGPCAFESCEDFVLRAVKMQARGQGSVLQHVVEDLKKELRPRLDRVD